MSTHHDPKRGHFRIDYGDGFEMAGIDLGHVIHLSVQPGRQQMTPDQARELAHALTTWADACDDRATGEVAEHSGDIKDCPACNDDEGRTVGEGARVLEEHMQQAMSQPDLFTEVTP